MKKRMKTTTAKRMESMTLSIPAPKVRLPRIPQRGATFRSGKEYSRKEGKRVSD